MFEIKPNDWNMWLLFPKVGSLTWNSSETAEFYIITAESNNGHKVQVSTNDTWTFISEFLCGQEYFLSVQAADSVCTSHPSRPSKLTSGRFLFYTSKHKWYKIKCDDPFILTCPISLVSLRALPTHWCLQSHELYLQHCRGVMGRLSGGRVLHGHSNARGRPVEELLVWQRAVQHAQRTVWTELHGESQRVQPRVWLRPQWGWRTAVRSVVTVCMHVNTL